ncbi:hypothetical protein AADZ90_021125 [Aestuariibius sp. 2305UL40-4]|uniref:hypothetical protein n=1 Tax=Aestuariibius violaceus TaxID=3234132 RepID=UPI00345E35A2
MPPPVGRPVFAALTAGLCLGATVLGADIRDDGSGLAIELNAVSEAPRGCHLTFQIWNATPADIDRLVYEGAFFTKAGELSRLALIDFGDIPAEARRIRRLTAPGLECGALGRVFFADASICETAGAARQACSARPRLTSRTDVEVQG